MKKCIYVVSILLLVILAGCSKKEEENKVKIAYFPNITHSQALYMKSKGLLEKKLGEDFTVEWHSFNAGPSEIEALFAGEVDLGYIGPVPAINGYVKSKGDVQIIAGATNAGAVLVTRPDAGITSIADLSEKTVAIPQIGNTQHLSLLNLLSENQLKAKTSGGTVNVIAVANSDVLNMMDQKQIDAALVPEPWGSILEKQGGANILLDYNEVWRNGDYSTAVVIVNKDFLEKHEDIVLKFLEVHKEATLYINENKSEAAAIINEEIKSQTQKEIDPDILESAFERIVVSEKISEESIYAFAQIEQEEDFIQELPEEDLCNSSLLNKLK